MNNFNGERSLVMTFGQFIYIKRIIKSGLEGSSRSLFIFKGIRERLQTDFDILW